MKETVCGLLSSVIGPQSVVFNSLEQISLFSLLNTHYYFLNEQK